MKTSFKTIVISDVHLGTKGSKAKEISRFLKQYRCENLILNGDIIDGWQLKKSGSWKRKHTRFFNRILKMIEQSQTNVYYLRGNHDDFLEQILPLQIGRLHILTDMNYESFGKKYFITHGDVFDSITTNLRWIAYLGDVGYTFLLWLNRVVNYYRFKAGLPYYSLSQYIKSKIKKAISFIDDYETELAKMAKAKGCDGIICGHIHKAENRMIDGIHYLNSGDWVETMSALAEDHEGNWQLIYYREIDFRGIQAETQLTPFPLPEATIIPLRQVSFESRSDDDITPPTIRL
ncbi:UDP-2,3-diacylglucosamine diphosphatase [Algoriphagus aestuariicola]|uniref:UDP-2,3-diacylglucosamine diphosphatase n=1 Tax=Algoriphagus aestuariicola TaxID=1852016 RepID=A0ABS3BWK2_9BACT|nr:UDP-2,3-diacylglucosamine diphosphatase [Algoriphagus aestuariicola]MBN7803194.1 UDP-2,3-diacylglucosamine diphosphatase [Algoriphagus aestuariicola]